MRLSIRSGLSAVILAASLAAPAPAHAQDEAGDSEEARRLFDEGTAAIRDGDLRRGRELLQRSLALHENVSTRFNLAVALRRLGQTTASIAAFTALLDGEHGELAPEQRVAVRQQLAQAETELGTLLVEVTNVEQARVAIDGDPVGSVAGAALAVTVDAGTHVVAASAPGYEIERRTVEVRAGRTARVELTLAQTSELGTLVVEAADGESLVQIVGGEEGRGLVESHVLPGQYTVRVQTSTGWRARRVNVRAERTTRVTLDTDTGAGLTVPVWVWVAGGAVIVAGAATITAVLLSGRDKDPVVDPVTGIGITLGAP